MSEEEEKKHDAHVTVSSLGNERRTVVFRELTREQSQEIIKTIQLSFETLRSTDSLLLTGSDGQIVFVNLKNVVFIEVRIA